MSTLKPLVLYVEEGLSQLKTGDTLALSSLGTGTPTAASFLSGDGSWASAVTSFAFTTQSGISGTVTNSTTTPTLALTLGNITPSSVTTSVVTLTTGATVFSSSGNVSSTSTTIVDSFSSLLYRSAKYQVQIADGTNYETLEVFIIHDGTTVFMTSYGNVFTSLSSLGYFDATLSANTIFVTFTASTATPKTIKFIRSTITV